MFPHPGPVKISHENDDCQRRPHRFHVSRLPLRPIHTVRFALLFCEIALTNKLLRISIRSDFDPVMLIVLGESIYWFCSRFIIQFFRFFIHRPQC